MEGRRLSLSPETTGDRPTVQVLEEAIRRAQEYLLNLQHAEGYWLGELEADSTLTSEYIMLRHFLDRVDRDRERKAANYLRAKQLPDGGWDLFPGSPSDISATVKGYFALKLVGHSADEPFMLRARENILAKGGVTKVNVFTKIALALFGQYDWQGVPTMPVEIMLLPRWSYFNLYEVSYWSRTVIVPLLVLMDLKPVCPIPPEAALDELYIPSRAAADLRFPLTDELLSWKNFFIGLDTVLPGLERWAPRPFRARARQQALAWMLTRMGPGGLGGIYPAMASAVMTLHTLGYSEDHPKMAEGLKEIELLGIEEADRFHLQPCLSPVWDTSLAMNALVESGLAPDDPALGTATTWLLQEQILRRGDWQVKRPNLPAGGWPFQFRNDFYPDTDDSAMVLMALKKVQMPGRTNYQQAIDRGLTWFLGMQSENGGWGSFDAGNVRFVLNHIPFADHGALLDPPTEDLAGRGLETLGTCGESPVHPEAARALAFIKETQCANGSWYGRWGANYIYGTWSVLRGLGAIGEDFNAPYVRRAVRWLEGCQNADGGWGETLLSYTDPALAGKGESMPSQTAWALLGLLAVGEARSSAVAMGIRYLLETKRPDGSWDDAFWNGTGFPRVFFLKYHLYPVYFPLWALGVYRSTL
ncbi:MAG: squalene--hopene cyclase [candidate division NC10 bacterium]|nr:squalene--hopene cyclase [candidate division NC10 bacterium]